MPKKLKAMPFEFVEIPHPIIFDPRLSATDIRLALALTFYAEGKAECEGVNLKVMAGLLGISVTTAAESLVTLQTHDIIRHERVKPTKKYPSGCVMRLCWLPAA